MDSNKMLIGFVAVLVAFMAFPVVMKKVNQQQAAGGGAAVASAVGQPAAATSAPAAVPAAAGRHPELDQPPLLNEANLTGTSWPVESSGYRIKVTLAPGGILYMTHPMAKALTGMDYIEGRWRVEYNKIFVEAQVGGNAVARELRIGGNKLYSLNDKGEPKPVEPY